MKRIPKADGTEHVIFEVGDRVRIQRKGFEWVSTVTKRNDQMVSGWAPYYEVKDGMGWYWHEEISEVSE